MSFENNIKEWVSIDNKIKQYNEILRTERGNRSILANNILTYAGENNLQHNVIQISDGKLKFNNLRVSAPLTYKFINTCLSDCISDEESVKQIMNYIKEKRNIKYTTEVKRYYN
jgi:hypothetical protein|tara:strand:- start:217 stop:558 length:342 start_codon:yes stop_codon:yes gene_type:complete